MSQFKSGLPLPLACPSFIDPAGWADNLRRLAPRMDDVELLFFQSDALPCRDERRCLRTIAADHGCTLTVHLPTDVRPCDPDEAVRRRSVTAVLRALEAGLDAGATRFILHLEHNGGDGLSAGECGAGAQPGRPAELRARRQPGFNASVRPCRIDASAVDGAARTDAVRRSLSQLLPSLPRPRSAGGRSPLCIENLDARFRDDLPVIRELDLSICLDIGHVIRDGGDAVAAVADFGPRLGYVHLHGVAGRDHRSVAALGEERLRGIGRALCRAGGRVPVCLEVFNRADLESSIAGVRHAWSDL